MKSRKFRARCFALLSMTTLLFAASALADVAVPPVARVTDLSGTLTPEQIGTLSSRLQQFEAKKGSQIAVLVVATTEPEAIEQYGIRLAEAWKLGRKGVDDGAILLVAKNDHAVRIEVGYGLEGALTDATSKRIIEEFIVPKFRQDDFYGGITAGLERIMAVVEGEPLPEPSARGTGPDFKNSQVFMMVLFFGATFSGRFLRQLLGSFPAAGVNGALIGALSWWLMGWLPFVFFFALLGVISALPHARGGGLGGYSGYGGGGFGGGGGFSGGGGGFGGGGASGRW